MAFRRQRASKKGGVGKTSYFRAKCVNISKTVKDTSEILVANRKVHALSIGTKIDELGWLCTLWVWIFSEFLGISQISDATTGKRMNIDQYCRRQRCKHVELAQFMVCFRVARVCQRQLGFFVFHSLTAHISAVRQCVPSIELCTLHLVNSRPNS